MTRRDRRCWSTRRPARAAAPGCCEPVATGCARAGSTSTSWSAATPTRRSTGCATGSPPGVDARRGGRRRRPGQHRAAGRRRHGRTARHRPRRHRQRHRPRLGLMPLDDPVAAVDLVVARRDPRDRPGPRQRPVVRAACSARASTRWSTSGPTGCPGPAAGSRYNLAILAELRTFRPVPYVLELDGERVETEAMLVAVGNGPVVRRRDAGLPGRPARRRPARRDGARARSRSRSSCGCSRTVYKGTHVDAPGGDRAPRPHASPCRPPA